MIWLELLLNVLIIIFAVISYIGVRKLKRKNIQDAAYIKKLEIENIKQGITFTENRQLERSLKAAQDDYNAFKKHIERNAPELLKKRDKHGRFIGRW